VTFFRLHTVERKAETSSAFVRRRDFDITCRISEHRFFYALAIVLFERLIRPASEG
jgi:hypothetical protein